MTASKCIYSLCGPRQAQCNGGKGPSQYAASLPLVTPAFTRLLTLPFACVVRTRDVLLAQLRKRPVPPPAA